MNYHAVMRNVSMTEKRRKERRIIQWGAVTTTHLQSVVGGSSPSFSSRNNVQRCLAQHTGLFICTPDFQSLSLSMFILCVCAHVHPSMQQHTDKEWQPDTCGLDKVMLGNDIWQSLTRQHVFLFFLFFYKRLIWTDQTKSKSQNTVHLWGFKRNMWKYMASKNNNLNLNVQYIKYA